MKFIDKIALLLGLLVFLISAGLYLTGGGKSQAATEVASLTRLPAGVAELPDYSPFVEPEAAEWREPQAQDLAGQWLYQVFTPPILYRVGNTFDVRPPERINLVEVTIPAFGLEFAEVRRGLYRLQLLAVIERDLDDMTTARAVFENVEAGERDEQTMRLTVGDSRDREEFDFIGLKKDSIVDEGGGLQVIYRATIRDRRTGAEIELQDNTTRFRDEVTFVFFHQDRPNQEILVREVGKIIDVGNATFTIVDINLAEESVTVVKKAPYLETPLQQTLLVGQSGPGPRTMLLPAEEAEALNLAAQPIYMSEEEETLSEQQELPEPTEETDNDQNSLENIFSN